MRTEEDATTIYRFDFRRRISNATDALLIFLGGTAHYRIEIADFAGEHTDNFLMEGKRISRRSVPDEFGTDADQNFLKWVAESDRCVLYIDASSYKKGGPVFVEQITNKYISFWQRYLDLHVEGLYAKAGTPVVVNFSKIDTLIADGSVDPDRDVSGIVDGLSREFGVLLNFLERNSKRVDVVAFSAVIRGSRGERLGVERFLRSLLPRRLDVELDRPISLRAKA